MPNLLIQKSMLPIVTNTIVDATKLQVPSLRSNHWLRHENNSLVRSITFPHLQLPLTQSGNGGSIFQTSIQQLSHPCWFSAHDIQVCFCLNHILMIPATLEDLLNDHSLHVPSSWMKEGGIAVGTRPPLLRKVKGVYSTPFTSILHPSDGLQLIFDWSRFLLVILQGTLHLIPFTTFLYYFTPTGWCTICVIRWSSLKYRLPLPGQKSCSSSCTWYPAP